MPCASSDVSRESYAVNEALQNERLMKTVFALTAVLMACVVMAAFCLGVKFG